MKKLIQIMMWSLFSLPASAELIDIDDEKLEALIEAGTPVVDVRRADEWKTTGVLEGSHLLTFFDDKGRYDARSWFEQLSALINPEEPFVLICHSGARSHTIGNWLGKEFDTVYNVEKGIVRWMKNGKETVAAGETHSDKTPTN